MTAPTSATLEYPTEVFTFSGQTSLDTWSLKDFFDEHGKARYHQFLNHEPVLLLERIRELVDAFPTYQHTADTGRPPVDERTHLIAMLLRQLLDLSFAALEGWLRVLQGFFAIPDKDLGSESTYSRKNRSPRFTRLLERFHAFLHDLLPERDAIIATDATGFSGQTTAWANKDPALRATENWEKTHLAVEIPTLVTLSLDFTDSHRHESQRFEAVWSNLPDNVDPVRSLADAAYAGNDCLKVAREHGATPIHDLRKDHRYERFPDTAYEKLCNFATHWPNRYEELTADRSLIESKIGCVKQTTSGRVRCRDERGRRNEVRTKVLADDVRMLELRRFLVAS